MKFRIKYFALLLLCSSTVLMGQVYVAQSSAGSNTGASCANARALSSLVSGDWVAGTTIHLCGTFTGSAGQSRMVNIQGSGSSGNPITILFEPGANATAPYWGTGGFIGSNSARSFITIDGGGTGSVFAGTFSPNGDIKATANGASLANHVAGSIGIAFTGSGSHDITVKNLECENMFVAVQNSANNETTGGSGGNSAFVSILDPLSNITIQNNVAHDMFNPVFIYFTTGRSNYTITGNKFYNMETNIIGSGNTGATLNGFTFTNNDLSNMALWDAPADANHHEFLHLWAVHTSSSITNATIAGNYFHGTLGATMTAETFIECTPGTCTVNYYNNLISMDDASSDIFTGAGGNGMTECKGGTCFYYNNTFLSTVGHGSSANTAMHFEASAHVTSQNNICSSMNGCMANGGGTLTLFDSADCYNLATSCTGATNLQTGNPNLDSSLKPQTGSAAIGNAANLTSLGITGLDSDRASTARPSSGAWDIGALNSSGAVSYTWTQSVSPFGAGTITGSNSASGSYVSGTTIGPLTATPATGYGAVTWSASGSAACSGSTNPCPSFTLGVDSAATATFAPLNYAITTAVTGSGSVSGCAGSHAYLSSYFCSASPSTGSAFSSWTSDCGGSGSGATYSGSMPAAACTVTANFVPATLTLSTTTIGTGSGTVTGCAGSYSFGDAYSCTVTPSAGSTIVDVTGCGGTGTTTYSGTMPSSSCTVTANFKGTAATPSYSPAPTTYITAQPVTISDSTPGAVIHYTTDGSTPTSGSPVYSGPLTISVTTTLKSIAIATGYSDSAVQSGTYTITPNPVRVKHIGRGRFSGTGKFQ